MLHRVLRLKPAYPEACSNQGNIAHRLGDFDQAAAWYEKALRLKPSYAVAHWHRALLWLLHGDFERGWPDYEWRFKLPTAIEHPGFGVPRWDGSDLSGRTILLYGEAGFGDTLQFVRYAPLVRQRGGRVIVGCQAPLLRLFGGMEGIDDLVGPGAPLPSFEVDAPLQSLPAIFRTTLASIPNAVPYLHADRQLMENWRRELAPLGGFKIGIVWTGNPEFTGNRLRSIPVSMFGHIAAVKGVRLISLQKGPGKEELRKLAEPLPVLDVSDRLDDFMDTAAAIMNLDLVITCDTAVAHLAGALAPPFGWPCRLFPIGAGCCTAKTVPGIPRCVSSAKAAATSGKMSLSAWRLTSAPMA